MARYLLECSLTLPRSVEETFRVFEDPRNLARITPDWLNFRITTPGNPPMRRGLEIDYIIRWMGLPMPWRTLISDYQPPKRFVDEQIRGPYKHWRHRHEFRPHAGGTLVEDAVEYELPLGLIGRAAHQGLVGRQLLAIFRFRQQAIGGLLQSSGVPVLEPRIRELPEAPAAHPQPHRLLDL